MLAAELEAQLQLWPEIAGGRAELINLSENHTFLVRGEAGQRLVRVHRPGYQSLDSIASELAWVAALAAETELPVPRPLPGGDGNLIQHLADGDTVRPAVMFHFFEGGEPREDENLEALFVELGGMAAITHRHARAWRLPAGFVRQRWDADAVLAPAGLWGDWRRAPGVTAEITALLRRGEEKLRAELARYGAGPGRFGLIHADMRLANVIRTASQLRLIDFDDSGFGWFMYDFGAAVSFIETRPDLPALRDAWIAGYTRQGTLAEADIAILDAMVLLRRMALLAWIGTHLETGLAQAHERDFAAGTARLVERYLR